MDKYDTLVTVVKELLTEILDLHESSDTEENKFYVWGGAISLDVINQVIALTNHPSEKENS